MKLRSNFTNRCMIWLWEKRQVTVFLQTTVEGIIHPLFWTFSSRMGCILMLCVRMYGSLLVRRCVLGQVRAYMKSVDVVTFVKGLCFCQSISEMILACVLARSQYICQSISSQSISTSSKISLFGRRKRRFVRTEAIHHSYFMCNRYVISSSLVRSFLNFN